MYFTQVELTLGNTTEVWWLPVPQGKAKVGEKITREEGDWEITQVCTTLDKDIIPENARIGYGFFRESETKSIMALNSNIKS